MVATTFQNNNSLDPHIDDGVVIVPAIEADFITTSTESLDEAARELFYAAWDAFDDGADQDKIDSLITQALRLEIEGFDAIDDAQEREEAFNQSILLHGEENTDYEGSDFCDYLRDRTMDALAEMQEELSEKDFNLDRGPTNYDGTYKVQAADKVVEEVAKMKREKESMSQLISYVNSTLGMKPHQRYDIDG